MTDSSPTAPSDPIDTTITKDAWLALSVTVLVTFLVVIDISAVNVAFPSIQDDFGVTRAQLSWVISGYNIMVGALLLAAGRYADSIGRRKVFLPGVAIFGIGSLLSGLAGSVPLLIAARLVQGAGGAITFATSFAVMLPEFPAARRSTAIGIAGATGALGAVAGPAVGSLLIEAFGWRSVFLVNAPLCLIVLFLGPRYLRESSDPNATGKIDLVGVLIGTASVALVMGAIVQSETWGVGDVRLIVLFVVGIALFPVLLRRSRSHPEPVLDLDLFRFPSFRSTTIGVTFYGLAFTGGALVNSLLLQDLWQQDITTTGLAFVPGPLLAAVASPIVGSVADRIGHRTVLTVGSVLCGLGYLLLLLFIGTDPQVWSLFVPLSLISGIGVGITVATWSSAGLSDIRPDQFGVAGATYNTIRQVSYALGVSVVIALVATGADEFDIVGYQRAWTWIVVCYFLAGAAVWLTFPRGSAADRAATVG